MRQKARNIIADFRMLGPLLEVEQGTELLRLCFRSVFCLPPADVLQKDASSPEEARANVRLKETVITEMPTRIEDCLELLDPWLNSQKDSERERAMQCAAHVLGFAATMKNFKMQMEITQLEQWVKLLALCCQDPVDNICFLSSQAAYNLTCILSRKKSKGKFLLSPTLQPPTWAGHPPTLCPGRVRPKKLIEYLIFFYESVPKYLQLISWAKIPTQEIAPLN
ncbi:uncharacterized protein LOC118498425 [Phyllostomus discolor]|uniref:Uncharacterized protein LOC118498425 n=1 Tax=Phyllostomus discolor TaxID=89673 RepID=A0A7E6CZN3_9CHIR|nr:uncharacterized protein LOC118498425 [Phyllostomus discolor]